MPSASGGFAPLNRGSAPGPCWGTAPRPPHRLALPRSPYSFVAFQFFFLQETNPDYSLGQQVSSDHAKPRLRNLRWLPVGQRVIFKTADPVWKCINSVAAVYLQELCTQVDNIRARSRLYGLRHLAASSYQECTQCASEMTYIVSSRALNSTPTNQANVCCITELCLQWHRQCGTVCQQHCETVACH